MATIADLWPSYSCRRRDHINLVFLHSFYKGVGEHWNMAAGYSTTMHGSPVWGMTMHVTAGRSIPKPSAPALVL